MSSMVDVVEMDAILGKLDEIDALHKKIEGVKLEIDLMVPDLKKKHPDFVAKLSTKSGYKGKFYSIRSRYNEDLKRHVHYVCKTDKAFGSWLKKPEKNVEVKNVDPEPGGSE